MAKKQKTEDKSEEGWKELAEKIGARIRELRKAKGYTSAEDFAYKFDIGLSQLGRYERGNNSIRTDILGKIIDALGVTWQEFFNTEVFKK